MHATININTSLIDIVDITINAINKSASITAKNTKAANNIEQTLIRDKIEYKRLGNGILIDLQYNYLYIGEDNPMEYIKND